jgi:hypothetical protein
VTGFLSIFRRGDVPESSSSAPPLPAGPRVPPVSVAGPPLPPSMRATPQVLAGPPLPVKEKPAKPSASAITGRRLLIGFDATASREQTWKQATRLTDTLIATLPGELAVSLAVHGGGRLHTVTRYTTDAGRLRDKAAGIRCQGGYTKLLDLLSHAAALQANCVLYIGDSCEESGGRARKVADQLAKRGVRVIILQEGEDSYARDVFAEIAERTGGALLPFDISSFDRIGKELMELVAVLAVQGVEAVEAKAATMPAATSLLLQNLDPKRLLIGKT